MNISQALKEKNKKAANLSKLITRVAESNIIVAGVERTYSSKVVLDEAKLELGALVKLKAAIHAASAPVREKIFRLSELKGLSKSLAYINTSVHVDRNRTTGDEISRNIPEITAIEHEAILKEWSDEIDKIQEELDAFNHTTSI